MAVESAADRAIFLDADEFGIEAEWEIPGEWPSTVKGIFDNDYLAVDLEANVAVASRDPRLLCATADLPEGHGAGDTVTIDEVVYKARNFEPDGTGMTVVQLEKQ